MPSDDLRVDDVGEGVLALEVLANRPGRPLSIAGPLAKRVAPSRSFVLVVGGQLLSDGFDGLQPCKRLGVVTARSSLIGPPASLCHRQRVLRSRIQRPLTARARAADRA